MHALTRLAASTWGCDLIRAREVYVKVIRAAMTYGAGVTHDPNHPKVARALQTCQNTGLRRVLGAYKATPIRNLELEAFCPPLDLYFNKRLVDFETRLKESGMGAKINHVCRKIKSQLRNRRGRPRIPKPIPNYETWATTWAPPPPPPPPPPPGRNPKEPPKPSDLALIRDWKQRWEAHNPCRGYMGRVADQVLETAFKGGHLELHSGLTKAQSSVLIQMRTGKIGLNAFLFHRKVPGYETPLCTCGQGPQTPEHLFTTCTHPQSHNLMAMSFSSVSEARAGLSSPQTASKMAKGLLQSGWLKEFQLSEKLRLKEGLADALAGWQRRPPPERHKRSKKRQPAF